MQLTFPFPGSSPTDWMDRLFLLSLLLSLTQLSSVLASTLGNVESTSIIQEDLSFRQVVPLDDDVDPLLNADHHFSLFKKKYGKTYSTQEEDDYRFSVFKANLHRAKRHQLLDPSAVHGITKFSDLTPSEFQQRLHLGHHKQKRRLSVSADPNEAPILPTRDLPSPGSALDYRQWGVVTPVKDQGSCRSSWAFSSTGALEAANALASGDLVSLSEQQLVDCVHKDGSGCYGGRINSAFEYIQQQGGIDSEESYPYEGEVGACRFNSSIVAAMVRNFSVVSSDVNQVAANLVKNGPLAVALNADWLLTYIGGVTCPLICLDSSEPRDDGALVVGYGGGSAGQLNQYWIVKNSWGVNWGEEGYFRLGWGCTGCGDYYTVSA
ncbi:cysteine proteinase 15A-like isoform X1 [Coffea arabica]|uniref:Cysteine proteinase 15A-like isoform X1 n=2 Tax=Coffea arabica TaxID=13443 RepID=A0A6P6X4C5_COFAR